MGNHHEPHRQAADLAFAELIGVKGAAAIIVQHLEKAFDVLPKLYTQTQDAPSTRYARTCMDTPQTQRKTQTGSLDVATEVIKEQELLCEQNSGNQWFFIFSNISQH